MRTEERYAEAERIAVRMGFHRAFVQAVAAQGEAADVARARMSTRRWERVARERPGRGAWPGWLARAAWSVRVRRSAPLGCRP
ncbi:MAG TPA: hypothetical protein VEL73_00375 [Mycobacteriales bacterium]|nr:hypothetical protein [Mycobacteriales bacterium]